MLTIHFFDQVIFYPTKGELIEFKTSQLSDKYIFNKDVFILPKGDGWFLSGSTYNHEDQTTEPTAQGQTTILNKLIRIVNFEPEVINQYAGIRPTVKDRRPILGIHHKHTTLAYFNGLGTKGVMLGPYFARLMAELVTNKNPNIPKEVQLSRFNYLSQP